VSGAQRRLFTYLLLAYLFAAAIDLATLAAVTIVWGFLRMWSVTAAALLSAVISRESPIDYLKQWFKVSKHSLLCYLSAPLLVYLALGVYALIAAPFGLFECNASEIIASQLQAVRIAKALASLAVFQHLLMGLFRLYR